MSQMKRLIAQFVQGVDFLTDLCGKVCAGCLFAIGFIITFEVVMRYLFNAPTIWADEVSRILQLWVVFLATAYVLKQRQMITVTVLLRDPSSLRRRLAETLAIVVLVVFMGVVVYYGFQLWLKASLAGHTTDSYLAPPIWLTHAPVWLGGALLMLQGLVQLIRVWTEGLPADEMMGGMH
ncbi:TRAP transporter small permease [Gammaproteobacteria bacterium]|nr:TRAP transporter small permease [Gammaproteobacteria bacterium]